MVSMKEKKSIFDNTINGFEKESNRFVYIVYIVINKFHLFSSCSKLSILKSSLTS